MGSNQLRATLFDASAIQRLSQTCVILSRDVLTEFDSAEARTVLAEADVLITGWDSPLINDTVLDVAPRLRLIAHAGGTVKQHVAPNCWDRGVVVTTAAQANAVPVAEYTLAFILLAGKKTFASAAALRVQQSKYPVDRPPAESRHAEIGNRGSTVGIIGASRIGRLVLGLLRPFGVRILLSDPTVTPAEAAELGAQLVPLHQLMATSRVVSLHAPVLPATFGMIGAHELAAMPDGATFINTARGVLVDQDALRAELSTGRISAVLDVTDPEPLPDGDGLYALPNVILTPHIAGSLGNELGRLGDAAVAEVQRFAAGLAAENAVSRAELERMA